MNALRRVMPFLRRYGRNIVFAVITLTLVVAAELMIPRQIQRVIDDGIATGDTQVIVTSMVIMIGLALIAMVLLIVNIVYSVRTSEGFGADLRDAAFRRSQELSYANLDDLQTGEMLVRLTSDINIAKQAVMMTLRMVFRAPLMIVGSLAMLLITSPTLALLLVVILPATVGIILWFSRRTEPMFKSLQGRLDRVNTVMQENISGVRVVKAFVRAPFETQRFGDVSTLYMDKGIEVNQLVALLLPTMLLLINLSVAGIVWFGGLLSINGQLTTGEIVAFTNYMITTMFPVMMLGMILPRLYAAEASVERILEIVDAEPSVTDRPGAIDLAPEDVEGRVVFEDVSLHYAADDGSHVPVLKGVSFVAEPGETVAILGATGSGKSSLVNLVPRFYDVTHGRVTIDGRDVRDVTKHSLRTAVRIAPQESVLFDISVRDNIRFGRPEAGEAEVVAAAKAAQAHEFILRKPDGYDETAGRRGANFSGGQRQRIAIARAVCARPKVLVLDDATSAVDAETESKIHDALHRITAGTTRFVVAQRVSTVLTADKIVVLDEGRVAAMGTHRALMQTSPIYREIYESQLGDGPVADRGNGSRHEKGAAAEPATGDTPSAIESASGEPTPETADTAPGGAALGDGAYEAPKDEVRRDGKAAVDGEEVRHA